MDEGLKKRLIGATVLVSLVVIFVPMLLEREPIIETGIHKTNVPPRPDEDFESRVLPLESQNLAIPPQEIVPLKPQPQPKPLVEERSDPPPPPQAAAPSAGEKPAQATAPIPQKPKTDTPPKPRVGLSAWVVQVGSFSKRENAEKLVKQLQQKSFSAFMEEVSIQGKTLYRVRVGPEIDRKLAEKMLERLNKTLKPMNLRGKLGSYP